MTIMRLDKAKANLKILEQAARKLDSLNDEVVYLGGCAVTLFITDPLLDVRTTIDVDCIVDIASKTCYREFTKKLQKQGFKQSINEPLICRWFYDEITLDVMPTDVKILGFSNQWYKKAFENTITYQLSNDITIKTVTPPYLLATKIDAFNSRGNNDFLASHDLEDIINIISGRSEIINEINAINNKLKAHIKNFFESMMENEAFLTALPGHINEGPMTEQRLKIVTSRINEIIKS